MSRLTLKDKCVLQSWLRSGATLAQVEAIERIGLVGNERFTEAARDRFVLLWTWSTYRFHGQAGMLQDSYERQYGLTALLRRINRVRRVLGFPTL
jgi:hypothetical protein